MNYTNDLTSDTKILFSHTININSIPYLIILGSCREQGFVCIPEYNISSTLELSIKSADINIQRLQSAGFSNKAASEIISHINEWISIH